MKINEGGEEWQDQTDNKEEGGGLIQDLLITIKQI
jgi:hypothetical protein